jgi:hypothetical protein
MESFVRFHVRFCSYQPLCNLSFMFKVTRNLILLLLNYRINKKRTYYRLLWQIDLKFLHTKKAINVYIYEATH